MPRDKRLTELWVTLQSLANWVQVKETPSVLFLTIKVYLRGDIFDISSMWVIKYFLLSNAFLISRKLGMRTWEISPGFTRANQWAEWSAPAWLPLVSPSFANPVIISIMAVISIMNSLTPNTKSAKMTGLPLACLPGEITEKTCNNSHNQFCKPPPTFGRRLGNKF